MAVTVAQLKAVISVDASGFESGLRKADQELERFANETEKTGRRAARGLEDALRGIDTSPLRDLGDALTAGITAPLAALGIASVKAATDMDSLKRGLTAVAGSAQEAEAQLKRLEEVAKLPGLGFEEAIRGSINLQAAGFSAQQAEEALKGFGNALATVGKGKADLDGVITALAQIASKGKISAEEINQLAERVPQIRKVMERAFGTSNTELLQKMGISAEEFVDKVTRELNKLPKATGGARNAFENLADEVKKGLAKVGSDALPILAPAVDQAARLVKGLADEWVALPAPVKVAGMTLAGIAAAVGPASLALVGLAEGTKRVIEAGKTLKDLGEGWKTVRGLLGGLGDVIRGKTLAVEAETAALERNTAAHGRNALAARGSAGARGLGGALSAGASAGILGVATVAGVGVLHHFGSEAVEARKQADQVDRDYVTWQQKRPEWHRAQRIGELIALAKRQPDANTPARQAHIRRLEADRARLLARDQERRKSAEVEAGARPSDQALAGLTAEGALDVEMQRAQAQLAGRGQDGRDQAEADALIPLLEKQKAAAKQRADRLREQVGKDEKATKEFHAAERDYWQAEEQIARLRDAAQKERQDAAKKAADETKRRAEQATQIREMEWENRITAARVAAKDGWNALPDEQAQAEAAAVIPLLQQKLQEMGQRARELQAKGRDNLEAARAYAELVREGWAIQSEIQQLKTRAAEEEDQAIRKAERERRETFNAWIQARSAWVEAALEGAPEGMQAATALAMKAPVLQQTQAEILALLKQQTPAMADYWKNVQEYWRIQGEIAQLQQRADKERQDRVKKATDDAKKAAQGAQQLAEAQVGLTMAQLQNNPFLNPRQRGRAMVNALVEQFRTLMRPVAGESSLDQVKRLTEGEGLKGRILQTMGITADNPYLRTRRGQQEAMGVMGELDRIARLSGRRPIGAERVAEAQRLARTAAAGQPTVFQVTLTPGMTPQQKWQEFVRMYHEAMRLAAPG